MMFAAFGWNDEAFGIWRMNSAKSVFGGDVRPRSLTVRIDPHAAGETLTFDRVEADGRLTSYSTILYLDGEPRQFQNFLCSGIQSSRRVDSRTVEVLRMCASGAWLRWVRRSVVQSKELILEVTEQTFDGRRFDRRLVLERK
jgi:hypothetical protein